MNFAVLQFPASNCDQDAVHALRALGHNARVRWHKENSLGDVDGVIVPGGFSYGDYLRTGAIARFSPIMGAIKRFASAGGPVLGICNGFQILCETGLLPGALLRNTGLRFVCRPVTLRVETSTTPATAACREGDLLRVPVAHGEGNYTADAATLDRLEARSQVVFRYVGGNPNGSARDIAGICNEGRNVVGLMPHPERACEPALGSGDGFKVFASLVAARNSVCK